MVQILYFQTCVLSKIYSWWQNECTVSFHGHQQTGAVQQKCWVTQCKSFWLSLRRTGPQNAGLLCLASALLPSTRILFSLLSVTFVTFLCILLVISLFKMTPEHVLKGCPVFLFTRQAVMEKMSEKLPSGLSFGAADCELNEPIVCTK